MSVALEKSANNFKRRLITGDGILACTVNGDGQALSVGSEIPG